MTDLLERIRLAQRDARELAALQGTNVAMASILAGERVVIENLRRIEAAASSDNVIELASRRP